jgi:hypothetical protein
MAALKASCVAQLGNHRCAGLVVDIQHYGLPAAFNNLICDRQPQAGHAAGDQCFDFIRLHAG